MMTVRLSIVLVIKPAQIVIAMFNSVMVVTQ